MKDLFIRVGKELAERVKKERLKRDSRYYLSTNPFQKEENKDRERELINQRDFVDYWKR